jgi:hydroxymethylpyrimidine pyrophosphatase-like HAD family hydrolase
MAVIAIDFDNTLVDRDKALPGAKEAINILREKGHKIIIHSCNNTSWIEKVLRNNDIRYDYIWTKTDAVEEDAAKPIADLYVDDKGFHFGGDWNADLFDILHRLEGLDNRKWKKSEPSSIAKFACGLQLDDEDDM